MKFILIVFILQQIFHQGFTNEYDYTDIIEPNSSESQEPKIKSNESQEPKNCTSMKFGCESCTNLVMCIDSEYGYMKQYVTCPPGTTCLRNQCTRERNPFCDGTASIPFKCHVPGMYPDPFDCTKYHFCVPESNELVNHTMRLKHFEHSCQGKDETGVQYKYDPMSTYCKDELKDGCQDWPVPLCPFEGFSNALEENRSLFYVCDLVKGKLYPHLYVCPHGELYNKDSTKCEGSQEPRGWEPLPENSYESHTQRYDPWGRFV